MKIRSLNKKTALFACIALVATVCAAIAVTNSTQARPWRNVDPSGPWEKKKTVENTQWNPGVAPVYPDVPPNPINPAPEQEPAQPAPVPPAPAAPPPQQNYPANATVVQVTDAIETSAVKRMGMNIGWYDQYAAAAYLKNVIPNPGFESAEMAMMFLAGRDTRRNVLKPDRWHTSWGTQGPGFWDDATFEVLQGPARGRTGKVTRFGVEGGKHAFYVNNLGIDLNYRDAVVVRKQFDGYYSETPTNFYEVEPNDRRPGSPGMQSLRLHPSNYKPSFHVPLDSFSRDGDETAGKMRILGKDGDETWVYSFWAKPTQPEQKLEIKFYRVQGTIFHTEIIPLASGWQKIERRFTIPQGADPWQAGVVNPIMFEIRIETRDADVLIDDAFLGVHGQYNPTAFTDTFVDVLREYNPGVLRNWGYQLGASLDNQLAVPHARKTNNFRPDEGLREAVRFHYSLHEFLELSQHLGAEAWYVIPPTWSPSELRNLIAYIAAPVGSHPYANIRAELGQPTPWTSVLPKIHLEYGNEMWGGNHSGDPFQGATLYDGYQVGEVSENRISIMRSSPYMNNKINLTIGGQAGFAERQLEIESMASSHDAVAIAPYYQGDYTLNYGTPQQLYYSSHALAVQRAAQDGKVDRSHRYVTEESGNELMIYEINSHYTTGWINEHSRNEYLTSLGAGITLPFHMLTYLSEQDIRTQTAYTALQYSFEMPGKRGQRARLWGMLRDLEGQQLKRPTWLAVEIVNKAIGGNLLETNVVGNVQTWKQPAINGITDEMNVPYVHSFVFKQGSKYGIVLFNLNLYQQQEIMLDMPENGGSYYNVTKHTLASQSFLDNNEDGENITIVSEPSHLTDNMRITLPANSIVVIEAQR